MLVEVCANSLESALNAEKAGADRIELCSELAVGGITPSYGLLKAVREQVNIPVNVLIRPRSGDFTYSEDEFAIMKRNIKLCADLGFNGIVSGVLHQDFSIDVKRTEILKQMADALTFTFHRAFDWVNEPQLALKDLESLNVDTVLTSGQQKSAFTGMELLTKLHQEHHSITIMPGGGINAENAHHFAKKNFKAVHLSGVQFHKTLNHLPSVSMHSESFLKDDAIAISNVDIIRKVVEIVK